MDPQSDRALVALTKVLEGVQRAAAQNAPSLGL